ncbi:MAG: DUF4835 family protein [Chitinophagaceae bacterium]
MSKKFFFISACFLIFAQILEAQEIQAKVTVNASRVGSQTDKKVFQTLQAALVTFVNSRKWTKETFQPSERIVCNFLLNINQADNNAIQSSLTIQAARPIYNSSYESPLINFIDENVSFRYVEYQNLEFNENRVSGTDPSASNLTAVFAYYINIILGLDFDSFSLRGGDPYFQKAQNIVNNAPDGRDIQGWKAFDGQRNRYWLMENLTNSRYALIHDVFYSYYRLGMDNMYDNETQARAAIMNTLNLLTNINKDAPNTMILQFFFLGKSNEFIKIFKKSPADERSRALEMLAVLDVTNSNNYKQELR